MANKKPKRVRLPDNVRLVAPITWGGDCYFVELNARRAPARKSQVFASQGEAVQAWAAGQVEWEDEDSIEESDTPTTEEMLREELSLLAEEWKENASIPPYQFDDEDFDKLFVPD